MFENATLHEAYTGSLIAGKGKLLNSIKTIMERTKIRNEDWTRVRFGAGTPWRRCWCVITPPTEKEVQRQQKQSKKKSAYERPAPLKGLIEFFDTKKTKKAQPIATINDAYSAYAIYPQSKPLIDQSTLIKVEGSITLHSTPETTTEGFVFIMPEVHPAVTGFEMMLRYIFPLYDVFALYGRPNRLIADTLDPRSLMFALPQERRYGYLEILDVAALIHENGSQSWTERQWRQKLKELTSSRMTRMTADGRSRSRASSYRGYRNSLPPRAGALRFEDGASIKSTPSLRDDVAPMPPPHQSDSAPPMEHPFQAPPRPRPQHQRSLSDVIPASPSRHQRNQRNGQDQGYTPSRLSREQSRPSYDDGAQNQANYDQPLPPLPYYQPAPPQPPAHGVPLGVAARNPQVEKYASELDASNDGSSSDSDRRFAEAEYAESQDIHQDMKPSPMPAFVAAPPAFSHEPGAKPQKRPGISPDMRRANSRLSITTLSQLADAGRNSTAGQSVSVAGAAAAWRSNSGTSGPRRDGETLEEQGQRGVIDAARKNGHIADRSTSAEGLVLAKVRHPTPTGAGPRSISASSSQQDVESAPYYKDKPLMSSYDLLSPQTSTLVSRNVSPLSQASTPPPPAQSPSEMANGTSRDFSSSSVIHNLTTVPELPSAIPMIAQRPEASRSSTGRSISRKPLPARSPAGATETNTSEPPMPASQPSLDSLHKQYIDEDALAQVLAHQHTQSITSESQNGLRDDNSSIYDNDSVVSPDYASTRRSTETRQSRPSVDKPRRGVLKTVGTVEPEQKEVQVGDIRYRHGASPEPMINPDIPTVDFGPTQAYRTGTSSRPNTGGTLTAMHERSKSSDRLTSSPQNEGPSELQRSSVVYSSVQPSEHYERAPSRNLTTPEPQLRASSAASDNDNRRSIAWQPGAIIGGGSPGARQSITPEQFVQQRAAASRVMTPIYAHGRQASGSPTPPAVSRHASGEWPIQQARNSPVPQQKRQSSYANELPARPHSRTASTMMNASGDYAAHLSAREQEHVARVTGSPLIHMAANANKNALPQGGGLVGAIEAREKEKKEMKEGLSSHMVQHAIAQHQQHGQGQQQRQSSYSTPTPQFTVPTPQFAMPGGYPPSPGQYSSYGTPQQRFSWNVAQPQPQQQYAQYQQYPPQERHWSQTGTQQFYGAQEPSPYQQQAQQQHQQGQAWQQGNYQQQAQYGEGQPHYYGPYFGNGQDGQ